MEGYSRIPFHRSSPALSMSGSVRSYDSRMELYPDGEDDDYGFKSMPEYALSRIFSDPDGRHSEEYADRPRKFADDCQPIPKIVLSDSSPRTHVKKKRKAPDPPLSGLVDSRVKYPSSDDIVGINRVSRRKKPVSKGNARPTSLSPAKAKADLLVELLSRFDSRSSSPNSSPRHQKSILSKFRSPRLTRKPSKKPKAIHLEDEEAGFNPVLSSNNSSFDDSGNLVDIFIYFGILPPDLTRDTEFEVR